MSLTVAQARDDSGELRAAAEAGVLEWDAVRDLSEIVDTPTDQLRDGADVTLFKALGIGLSDVALGAEVLRRAKSAGAGSAIQTSKLAHH